MPVHKIPNYEFAFWGCRHQIHILFPNLVSENRSSSVLTQEEKATFYESVLRPAIQSLSPQCASDWPSTYSTEIFRAQKRSGHLAYQTKIVSAWLIDGLVNEMRSKIEESDTEWAKDFVFLHTLRGTKHGTQHQPTRNAAEVALLDYLNKANILETAMSSGDWYVDVALEFSSEEVHCLQWKTSSHYHLVRALLDISEDNARRITERGSSKYSRDVSSHLPAVSGCRIEPGSRAQGSYEAVYYHMYTTDKSLTYNPEGGHHGKAITMSQAMGTIQPPPFIVSLLDTYTKAIENNASNARLEVRVPITKAARVLIRFDPNLIRRSLLLFRRDEWW